MTTCATCPLHLEATYPTALCPRCLADAVLTEAVEESAHHVQWAVHDVGFDSTQRRFVEHVMTNAATTADAVLHEYPVVLARFAHT